MNRSILGLIIFYDVVQVITLGFIAFCTTQDYSILLNRLLQPQFVSQNDPEKP